MARIWWQYSNWGSNAIEVWEPNTLPNFCTLFRSAWINQWFGWKYYIHGHYPGSWVFPYKVARPYNFPEGIPANGNGVWSEEQYAEWYHLSLEERYKNYYVLEHTLGKQYLPMGPGENFRIEDHRFAWWNNSGVPNITGTNQGRLRDYGEDKGCINTTSMPITISSPQSLDFWLRLVDLSSATIWPSMPMRGLPVTGGSASIKEADHDFVVGPFEGVWSYEDARDAEERAYIIEHGIGDGDLPSVPRLDDMMAGEVYPNYSTNFQAPAETNKLQRFLMLMRNRFDAAGAFKPLFQGETSQREWHYSASREQWEEGAVRHSHRCAMLYWGYRDAGWHVQSEFIDPSYSGGSGDPWDDNTLKNVIWGHDPNFNYAIVSCQRENYPAGGAPFEMPSEKWYCHEIIDFSQSGTTLDSLLPSPIGPTGWHGAGNINPENNTGGFSYERELFVVQYPRKKLPPDFRSFDQPAGVSHPDIWGTTGGN